MTKEKCFFFIPWHFQFKWRNVRQIAFETKNIRTFYTFIGIDNQSPLVRKCKQNLEKSVIIPYHELVIKISDDPNDRKAFGKTALGTPIKPYSEQNVQQKKVTKIHPERITTNPIKNSVNSGA